MTNPTACRELKPCPFCGSSNVYIAEPDDGSFERFVRCENCLATGPGCTNASPEAACNTRATEGEGVACAGAYSLALLFHETYETLAPSFGYETRKETRAFDAESPNGKLMIAVCERLWEQFTNPRATSADGHDK